MSTKGFGLMLAIGIAVCAGGDALAVDKIKLDGYLEFRKGEYLIVDAQRVQVTPRTKFKGSGGAKSLASLPLGYEVRVKGTRQKGGTVLASEIEAALNGTGGMEKEILAATDQAEKTFRSAGKIVEPGPDGKETSLGTLHSTGPQVERARKIVNRILPSYVDPAKVRVYVVDNKEWNAMAMANYSVYVFSGLMADMDDNELAIVLGHEIAHATHEHSRRQAKKDTIGAYAGQAAALGAEYIKNPLAKDAARQATALGMTTFSNVYSREYEDQADRVGLRYVHEGGYDYTKAPALWRRFAQKYGDQDKVTNFFFGDHSLSTKRAAALEKEIANNYPPAKDAATATQ